MKVLMLGQIPKEYGGSYTTGVANVIINLAKVMESDGHSIAIFGTNYAKQKKRFSENVLFYGFDKTKLLWLLLLEFLKNPMSFLKQMVIYKTKFGVNPVKHTAYRVLINHVIKDFNPQVIHMHGMLFSPFIQHIESDCNTKIVMTFHGIFHNDKTSIKSNLDRGIDIVKLNNEGSKLLKHVTFLTNEMLELGFKTLNLNRLVMQEIIPNGISSSVFNFSIEKRGLIRKQLDIDEETILFISVGALTHRKNHIGFIDFLNNNKISSVYIIVGQIERSESGEELLSKIEDVKNIVRVIVIDYVSQHELFKYYSASDMYAHPSYAEGQALVVFEALACGLPVVVNTKIFETIDLNSDYDKYIEKLKLDNKENIYSKRMDSADRLILAKKARAELSWDNVGEKYIEFFKNI